MNNQVQKAPSIALKDAQDPFADDFFVPIGNTKPYFKVALEGDPGTGKSHTAAQLAAGLHRKIKSKKPIAIIDTEKASKFLIPIFEKDGIEVIVRETQSLADFVTAVKKCEEEGLADILIVDSITHLWMNFQEAYKRKLNRQTFQIQDWMAIKADWNKNFANLIVNSKIHIIATGRISDRMEQEVDEDGRKEFTKTGVKMQAEKNAAYEFDMLILMERHEIIQRKKREVWRQAVVLKGRGNLLDGAVFKNPTYEDFAPAIDAVIKDPVTARFNVAEADAGALIRTEEDKRNWVQAKKRWLEEIEGYLVQVKPGQDMASKKFKVDAIEYAFGTRSWTAIEGMSPDALEFGFGKIQEFTQRHISEQQEALTDKEDSTATKEMKKGIEKQKKESKK
jgi:KaiC/GvpD/RAD55 family RecA-like ATPase